MTAERVERWLIVLIAIHSYGIGLALLFLTRWGVAFGGWSGVNELFFARQAGAFHLAVATGYLVEYFRHDEVSLIVVAKSCAVAFLLGMALLGSAAWAIPVSAFGDAAMVVVVLAVRHWRRTQSGARSA